MGSSCFCNNLKAIQRVDISVPTNDTIKEATDSNVKNKKDNRIMKKFLKVKSLKNCVSCISSNNQGGEISTENYIKMKSQKVPFLKEYSMIEQDNWKEEKSNFVKEVTEKNLLPTTTTQPPSETILDNSNNNNTQIQSQRDISNVIISEEEEERMKTFFKEHYLFHFFNEKYIQGIIDELPGFLLESDSFIFREGDETLCFFLIKSGKCLMISDNETSELNEFESFGELAISYEKDKTFRTYSIKTLTNVEIFWIDNSFYQSLRKTMVYLPTIDDIIINLNKFLLFNYLPQESKEKLASLVSYNKLLKGTKFISKNSKLNKDSVYIISQGQLCLKLNTGYTKYLYSGSFINANQVLLYSKLDKRKYDVETCEETICLVITKSAFIEVFGLAYQRSLLFQCFTKTINQNSFLSLLVSKAEMDLSNLFKAFQIKDYNDKDVVYVKNAQLNKKYIFIFEGELFNTKTNELVCNQGQFYGDNIALRFEE